MPFQAVKSADEVLPIGGKNRQAALRQPIRLYVYFKAGRAYPPLNSSAQAERRRYGFGTASILFRQRPRAPPAAARTRQHKQADKRRRAISLRLPYRFGGGQGYIPTPRRRSSSVKSRTGIDLPILHGNAAVPKAAVRSSPADPAERRHKKRPDKHRCPPLHWISVPRPAFTAPRRRRRPSPAFGKRQSQSRQTPQLGRFAFSQPRVEGRGEIRAFERRRTAA